MGLNVANCRLCAVLAILLLASCGDEEEFADDVIEQQLFASGDILFDSPDLEVCWLDNNWTLGKKVSVRRLIERSWGEAPGLRFYGWGPCESPSISDIELAVAPGVAGGSSTLNSRITFKSSGNPSDGEILHEFGHALGYFHEHARADTPETCRAVPYATDLDNDGISEMSSFDSSDGKWYVSPSSSLTNNRPSRWGVTGDEVVLGDYDGDGFEDRAVFRPSSGRIIHEDRFGNVTRATLAGGTDSDAEWFSEDIDQDGSDEIISWSNSSNLWRFWNLNGNQVTSPIKYGVPGDIPLVGIVNGSPSIVIWRPYDWARDETGVWFARTLNDPQNRLGFSYGERGDIPFLGELNGSAWSDEAIIYRPGSSSNSLSYWYGRSTAAHVVYVHALQYGLGKDTPLVGDWNGNGRVDFGLYRLPEADWYAIDGHTETVVLNGVQHGPALGKSGSSPLYYGPYDASSVMTSTYCNRRQDLSSLDEKGTDFFYPPFDEPFLGDFDGDGRQEYSIFRRSSGRLYSKELGSGTKVVDGMYIGDAGTPLAIDSDGDGVDEFGRWLPRKNEFKLTDVSSGEEIGSFTFPVEGNASVVAVDADQDGREEVALLDPAGQYWLVFETDGTAIALLESKSSAFSIGFSGRIDGQTVLMSYSPSNGRWIAVNLSGDIVYEANYGIYRDTPLFEDVNGDADDDMVLFRSRTSQWFVLDSDDGVLVDGDSFLEDRSAYPFIFDDGTSRYLSAWSPSSATWTFEQFGSDNSQVRNFGWSR